MKPGQAVTHHRNGGRHLEHLGLTDHFQRAFTQNDNRGRRVTEAELPRLSTDWKHFLDNGILEIGHSPSPWASKAETTKHTPTLAEPLT